jgi:hypothetical protein
MTTNNADAGDQWVNEVLPARPVRYRIEPGQTKFWPPRPSRFWATVLEPLRHWYARRMWGMGEVDPAGTERTFAQFAPSDGVLVAPNHSFDADAHP